MSIIRKTFAALLVAALLPGLALAQDRGTVTGSVVNATTQQPLAGAQVIVVGTQIGTLTNQQGRFVISNVPAGARDLRASLIGFGSATRAVNVGAGQTVNVDLVMRETAVALDEIIVTATGQLERRRETGNVVNRISAADIEPAAVNNLSQVLTARAPGVVVTQASGTTGTSQRIRIRGNNSISLSNDPLLIVDGVRMNANALGMNTIEARAVWVGGQETSRWNDISPDEIESIEIIKGPAAAALYGTAAANGVIQITTKRGQAGTPQWSAYTEAGQITPFRDFPLNYQQIGRTSTGARTPCPLDARVSTRSCVNILPTDTLYAYQPLNSDPVETFRDGWRVNHGLQVTGGSDMVTYFLAGELEREQGTLDPNLLDKVNLRANLRSQLRENISATVTTGYVRSELNLPQSDNNGYGMLGGGLLGTARADLFGGWFAQRHPNAFYMIEAGQNVNRFTGGLDLNWIAQPWLSVIGQFGLDDSQNEEFDFAPAGLNDYSTSLFEGWRRVNRVNYRTLSANLSGTATRSFSPDLQSSTSLGTAFTGERMYGTYSYGRKLLQGTGALGGASEGFEVDESRQEIITVGAYARQQFAWRDRLFVTASVRGDDNSAFGQDFEFVVYPALSGSWVVSEEPFFPELSAISSLRLRAAYGQSGQRPRFRQADTFFNPVAVTIAGTEVTAVTVGGTGNALLKPERSAEVELGFDAGLLDDRVSFELTWFDRTTNDALVARRLAPSLGATATRFENVGQVSNYGLEALLSANLITRDPVRWDMTVSVARIRNNLDELGEGVEPIIFGSNSVQQHRQDFPLGSFFKRPIISYNDLDGDGILSRANCPGQPVNPNIPGCEVVLGDTAEYLGTPFPRLELGFSTNVALFDWFRMGGQLDYKGGHKQLNFTEYFRCVSFSTCEAAVVPFSSFEDQAANMAARMGSEAGYIQDATFLKLRELSFTFNAPQSFVQRFGTSGLSLTVAGRNLKTWSPYKGFDPEVNSRQYATQGNYDTQDFLAVPASRYWTARVNLNF